MSVSLNFFQIHCSILEETEASDSLTKSVMYTVVNLRFCFRPFLFGFSGNGRNVAATNYLAGRSGTRIPAKAKDFIFSTIVQTGSWPHLACNLMLLFVCFFVFCGAAAQRGPWPTHSWGFLITHSDASQSVGLLWTSDRFVAETSTWQHTTLTTDKHPCPRWDSNPRSQQPSGLRPRP